MNAEPSYIPPEAPDPFGSRPLRRALWTLAWPLRAYVRRFPVDRGKGAVLRWGLTPLLPPPPARFRAGVPGGVIELEYRDRIGFSHLVNGEFERAERRFAESKAVAGSLAIDVGANVGLYTISLANAVGPDGRVLAYEPGPENAERLRANLRLNSLSNVTVEAAAVGSRSGESHLHLATDSAYHSLDEPTAGYSSGDSIAVRVVRLDDAWTEQGRPGVSLVKVDVEGSEMDVLHGAEELLRTARPVVIVEAASPERRAETIAWFDSIGFESSSPPGFLPWNLAFIPR